MAQVIEPTNDAGYMVANRIEPVLASPGASIYGQISILIPIEMLRSAYIERGLHPKNLARTVEDSATIFEPILPWTAAGAYMTGTLGVATLSYLPWAALCWSGIFFATLWGFTGFGIARLTKEKQQQLMTEITSESK